VSFAWNRGEQEGDEAAPTYYNLPVAKSALGSLRRLHADVAKLEADSEHARSQPIGSYVESDADEDARALVEAYWDCALTLWDCLNRQVSALNVGDEQTIEDATVDIAFALKVVDHMGLADW
jgi:hypothetical protein